MSIFDAQARATRSRVLFVLFASATLAACEAEPSSAPEPTPSPAPAGTDPQKLESVDCGPRGERFASWSWVPNDAKLATLLTTGESLDASTQTLGAWVDDSGEPIPIFAGLEFQQLSFASKTVRNALAAAGFHPAQLLRLLGPGGETVWAWSTTCDLDEIERRVGDAWRMSLHESVEGRVGRSGDEAFPFELLLLSGGRALLVPAGDAQRVSMWLDRDPSEDGLGARLAAVDEAPIVSLVQGHALLLGDGSPRGDRLLIRVFDDEVEIVATQQPDPE